MWEPLGPVYPEHVPTTPLATAIYVIDTNLSKSDRTCRNQNWKNDDGRHRGGPRYLFLRGPSYKLQMAEEDLREYLFDQTIPELAHRDDHVRVPLSKIPSKTPSKTPGNLVDTVDCPPCTWLPPPTPNTLDTRTRGVLVALKTLLCKK